MAKLKTKQVTRGRDEKQSYPFNEFKGAYSPQAFPYSSILDKGESRELRKRAKQMDRSVASCLRAAVRIWLSHQRSYDKTIARKTAA